MRRALAGTEPPAARFRPMTSVQERTQSETVPRCIYCERGMTATVTDRLTRDDTFREFRCKDCGWEVVVPLR